MEIRASGTATNPIRVTRYGTASVDPRVTGLSKGYCFLLRGNHLVLERVRAVACGYPSSGVYGGIGVWGSHNVVQDSYASRGAAGISIKQGSDHGIYRRNTLRQNNVMNVNTPGGADDSGAFGFVIQGNDNLLTANTVSGSAARSYDYNIDGGAFEIYNGNSNRIENNTSIDNNNFSELGHSAGRTATGNSFTRNTIRATCSAMCTEARGLIVRGAKSKYGPNTGTVFADNSIYLTGPTARGVTCHAGCSSSILQMRGNRITVTGGSTGAYAVWTDGRILGADTVFGPVVGYVARR